MFIKLLVHKLDPLSSRINHGLKVFSENRKCRLAGKRSISKPMFIGTILFILKQGIKPRGIAPLYL